ncbi:putative transcription regulator containing HTH domain [Flammeovirgaceae bacterium 311]|nr:putative transcription regulator containing HTH domain [Flammeovirgaceae bacterium 311]
MKWNKVITTEQEYFKVLKRLDEIFHAHPDTLEGMEAELLVTLVEKWESQNYPIKALDPIDAIKEGMVVKGLKDKDLVEAIGSKSGVSQILNRKRYLTVEMIRRLSDLLNISVEVLIQPYELNGNKELETSH